MKKIILTGGGTAGHVMPNLALVPTLREAGFEIKYIGSKKGMEKGIIENAGIPYFGIASGKLRRYLSPKNLVDPFKVMKGYLDAKRVIKREQPDIIFSKGGFVTVPVVFAANRFGIPVIIHESDMTPGLANKLASKKATKICYSFPETEKYLEGKGVHTGSPIRQELFEGEPSVAKEKCRFNDEKPIILVTGGSLGAENVNKVVRKSLDELLKDFQIAHLCGRDKVDHEYDGIEGYAQFEVATDDMKDFFAMADLIISRAGSNSIFEIISLNKPNILIPLPAASSRGDQILNAESFKKQGFSEVLEDDPENSKGLVDMVHQVFENKDKYIKAMSDASTHNGVDGIMNVISKLTK